VLWELDDKGSPKKSPGGTKQTRMIKWSDQKTVRTKVSHALSQASHACHSGCSSDGTAGIKPL
jgi:hypothetical protein